MAELSRNRIAWTYTDDGGNAWRVAAQAALVGQAKQGGAAAASTVPQKPAGIKMRRCTVSNAAGFSTTVHVYDTSAPIVSPGETINANVGGDTRALTSNGGYIPEGPTRRNVTKQST